MDTQYQQTGLSENICKNCGCHFHGSFCNECGQKVISKRNTLKHFFNLVFDSFDIHKGVLFTAKQLFINPGQVINDYLQGKTKIYYNPLRYLVIFAGIYALLMIWLNIFDTNLENANDMLGIDSEANKLQSFIIVYMKRFLNIFTIIVLPFYSLASKWVTKKHKLNYAEHLIINSYLFAQYSLILTLTVLVLILIPGLSKFVMIFSVVVFVSYYTYAFKGIFKISFLKSLFSSITVFVVGVILFWSFLIIAMIIIIVILKFSGVNLKELVQ